eukprot:5804133-Amphidinium_carterae.1
MDCWFLATFGKPFLLLMRKSAWNAGIGDSALVRVHMERKERLEGLTSHQVRVTIARRLTLCFFVGW